MKRINLYLLALFMITTPVLQSCDDDGESLGKFIVQMATVRVVSGNAYYLETDNGNKLWPAATAIPRYIPVDGQRVLVDYTKLGTFQDHTDYLAVRVNFLTNVLTKQVEELTEENESEYGNDLVRITDMWIGGNYLNIEFVFNIPYYKPHRVNLVRNTTTGEPLVDAEGYIHLEYRYNNRGDVSKYARYGFVSFNLGDYAPSATTEDVVGLKVKINSIHGERTYTCQYRDPTHQTKSFDYTTDIVDEGLE